MPLRDIHLPDAVSWWPPAPGWWLLLVLMIILAVLLAKLIRYLKQPKPNRLALAEFKQIKTQFQQQQNHQQLARDLSALLRRIGLTYYSREQVASLTSHNWQQQLNGLNPQHPLADNFINTISAAAYQPTPQLDAQHLLDSCEQWLKNLPRRRP
ncbi:MAG: DUF4381 domain-containing protein [Gammaproteobacteria bacterium]|nr:DUF4381 domain-containing protein [Gammaproteobacteria bacterium]